MRNDRVYLEFIRGSITAVHEYLDGASGSPDQGRLFAPGLHQDAALRRMEMLADAAGRLSEALKLRHPEIHWRRIVDFRNVLAHAYIDLDLGIILETIATDLPALQAVVEDELHREASES